MINSGKFSQPVHLKHSNPLSGVSMAEWLRRQTVCLSSLSKCVTKLTQLSVNAINAIDIWFIRERRFEPYC